MISKKTLLAVSGILSVLIVAMGTLEPFRLCGGLWRECMDLNYIIDLLFLPIIPLFILALITYKMRDEVYRAWLRFAYVWIPLSMLLIFLAPEYSTDWMFPVVKGTVAFFSSILFVIISLILIVWKYVVARRNGNN